MKDERGKKMWELLICDETRSFEHAEFFPNNRINSVELSKAINRVIVARGRAAHSSTLELNLSRGRERERERERERRSRSRAYQEAPGFALAPV